VGVGASGRRPGTGGDPAHGPQPPTGPPTAGSAIPTSTASNDTTARWPARFLLVSKQGCPWTVTPSRCSDAHAVKPPHRPPHPPVPSAHQDAAPAD
jgi:hypothetical protein